MFYRHEGGLKEDVWFHVHGLSRAWDQLGFKLVGKKCCTTNKDLMLKTQEVKLVYIE
jgi:hypothetical protein